MSSDSIHMIKQNNPPPCNTATISFNQIKVQENIVLSRKEYVTIINYSLDFFAVLIDDKFAVMNESALELFGESSKEGVIGQSILAYIHEDFQDSYIEQTRHLQLLGNRKVLKDYVINRADNRSIYVDLFIRMIECDGAKAIEVMMRDVTLKKNMENDITGSELRYRKLVDNLEDFIGIVDIKGKCMYINKAGSIMLGGTKPSELIGQTICAYFHEDYQDACKRRIRKAILDKEPYPKVEKILITKTGKWKIAEVLSYPIEFNGQTACQFIIRDITKRKNAERQLESAKIKYERLIESSTNGIAIIQDNQCKFVNEAARNLFEAKTKEQLLGKGFYKTLDDEFNQDCKKLIESGGVTSKSERILTTLAGKELHTEVIVISTTFEERPAIQLIIRDVTEQKQAQHLMVQAEKMNIVGQLAAGIAHEIRNPLTSLKGFVQLFRSGTMINDEFLDIMEAELERIDIISSEFLSLAKPGTQRFAPTNLLDILEDVVALLDTEAFKYSVTIQKKFRFNEIVVFGLETQLKQVFINLIKNAIEGMPEGGIIEVKANIVQEEVQVSIKDQGVGMTKSQLVRLGEPFYTTKEKGTGLGLMVSYSIVKNHKGKIEVKSKPKKGTTFTVMLPLHTSTIED
ncbi:PAS domain S-box protein [Bacillus sp. HMF5848]|uniref:PAS domain S-box protein n=1 Tax=Bacillus sp. HMF5848 TaxID=2495421 RepID=UPI00163ABEBC|nr:PAS domain S-box protein [Bacillus sp. HMF5848]